MDGQGLAGLRGARGWLARHPGWAGFLGVGCVVGIGFAIGLTLMGRAMAPPPRGFSGQRDFHGTLDRDCIQTALRGEFGIDFSTVTWATSVGKGPFPEGVGEMWVSYYSTPDGHGWASLDIGQVGPVTRVVHDFTGTGSPLPQSDLLLGRAAMDRAAAALKARCHFDLAGIPLHEIGQRVDFLHPAQAD